ncbi:hypothetical protein ES288_A09G016300v1 [Gossypium darwinii]|uniref:Uncharacterized protein n=1 Tax=Gossypium darwinii TaxID=34276 RepID=A0A5D2F6R4_GOSDA|nr:hypothetical protein ES288_A09G016300v1 [Gossypium darwinii]
MIFIFLYVCVQNKNGIRSKLTLFLSKFSLRICACVYNMRRCGCIQRKLAPIYRLESAFYSLMKRKNKNKMLNSIILSVNCWLLAFCFLICCWPFFVFILYLFFGFNFWFLIGQAKWAY